MCCRHIWLTSKQQLSVRFNPSALLSVGDLLAFMNALKGPMPNIAAVMGATRPSCTCKNHFA